MKRMAVVLGMIALSALAALPVSGRQRPTMKAEGDEAAIGKVRAAYEQAAAAQDAAGIAKLYAADGMELPPNAPAAKGRAAIEKYHKDFGQQFMVHGVTITRTETHVYGNAAIDIGTYKQSLMMQKGGSMIDDKGKYVVVLTKDGSGNWLIKDLIYNSDNPPPPMPAPKK